MLDVLALLDAPRQMVRLDTAGLGAAAVGSSFASGISLAGIMVRPALVDVSAAGLEFPFDWGTALPGTDRLELASITIDVQADAVEDFGGYPMGELPTELTADELVVKVPGGQRVRALNLTGLKSDGVTVRSEQELAAGQRLDGQPARPARRLGSAHPVGSARRRAGCDPGDAQGRQLRGRVAQAAGPGRADAHHRGGR